MARKVGKPTKLTPKRQQTLLTYIAIGAQVETAAKAAGIHRDSFYEWLQRGARETERRERGEPFNDDESIFVAFSERLERAIAEAEINDLDRIDKAAETIWQAAAWKLERLYPDRYALKNKVEHSGPDGRELVIRHVHDWRDSFALSASGTNGSHALEGTVQVVECREALAENDNGDADRG
jgi:hypothetical protein